RGYVVIALPLAALLSICGRYYVRKQLHHARARGDLRTAVIAVGDAESVADLAHRMHAERHLGMQVVGACIPRKQLSDQKALNILAEAKVTPLGDLDSVVTAVSRSQADAVAVTSSRDMTPNRLRELSWQMERVHADLIVSPGLIEVAGPRLHIRPITGLPLLQIEKPEFAGMRRVVKGFVDRTAAGFGLLLLSPIMLVLILMVRMNSAGPAFFHQTRVGKDGEEFKIWKFRSMYVDAEARLADHLAENENVGGGMFKMKVDPRVTSVGRIIRRFSLDELPQLINVLNGTMSLVGPRPPLPREVATYPSDVRRRLLVRPGVTGLWQVSGRSDLSWEETVRLDLRYVENWSLGQDAMILWKTLSAVLHGSGAY
ncbi:MAG: exopolysaccharide biosynthesis polyprenyl glycosylphosphotransferase, partial [Pseudonocardiales bacterium]|nr:exopolysaccharide biosynthesis polyprenyl glycosylphosphotransferase [Pseudonocardiales bacterium]